MSRTARHHEGVSVQRLRGKVRIDGHIYNAVDLSIESMPDNNCQPPPPLARDVSIEFDCDVLSDGWFDLRLWAARLLELPRRRGPVPRHDRGRVMLGDMVREARSGAMPRRNFLRAALALGMSLREAERELVEKVIVVPAPAPAGLLSFDAMRRANVFTLADMQRAVALLERSNVQPADDGFYYCRVHPSLLSPFPKTP